MTHTPPPLESCFALGQISGNTIYSLGSKLFATPQEAVDWYRAEGWKKQASDWETWTPVVVQVTARIFIQEPAKPPVVSLEAPQLQERKKW